MLLIAYNQSATIEAAIAGALAQTYPRLEIIVSDDASSDNTWACIERATANYAGPHTLRLNRNERNQGIGAHLSALAAMARGELLFVTAGDDVSLPDRCSRTVVHWVGTGKRIDLIASPLIDLQEDGSTRGDVIRPSDLSQWPDAAAWAQGMPHVVGAGQAWTRRLFDRFGPLPRGTVAEDLVMVFRAIVSGGACTLDEPLVQYRRGGISRQKRVESATQRLARMVSNARHTLVELPQVLRDADVAGVRAVVEPVIAPQLARHHYVMDQSQAEGLGEGLKLLLGTRHVPFGWRWRVFVYRHLPALLAPVFWLKRRLK